MKANLHLREGRWRTLKSLPISQNFEMLCVPEMLRKRPIP
jgi:hypothetical protein